MRKTEMISADQALPGRDHAIAKMEPHFINLTSMPHFKSINSLSLSALVAFGEPSVCFGR